MALKDKSILMATDLSARSDRPLDRALALAKQWDARLTILHVLEARMKEGAETSADTIREQVQADLPAYDSAAVLIVTGSAPETIVRIAKETDTDLIVTGVARYNSMRDYVLGTTVDHIIRHATVPVLIVKTRPRKPYRSLLVATDRSDCSRDALLTAADLFPEAALHLVHAYHVPYEVWLSSADVHEYVRVEAERDLDTFLNSAGLSPALRERVQATLGYGEIGTVISQAIRDTGADLVVLGTHGRNGFRHATIGSIAESLLSWVPVDTLMVREHRA